MIVLELSKRDLGRINAVDLLVSKFFHTSLYQFCSKYMYDVLFIEIIKQVTNKYDYDRMGYFEVELPDDLDDRYYEVEKKFSYGVDNRSVAERVISLGVNWVVEDVIVHKSSSVFILKNKSCSLYFIEVELYTKEAHNLENVVNSWTYG